MYSREQINGLREIVEKEIQFSTLMREVTDVENLGQWSAVRCPFHNTSTKDAGRLKDATGDSSGVYFCNHPGCKVSEEPYNGRLSLTHFWKLYNDLENEPIAVLDLYQNRLGRKLPAGEGKPLSKEELEKLRMEKRRRALFLQATFFFHMTLLSPEGKEGMDYLLSRGISRSYIEKYKLGYAPGGRKMLDYLKSNGFSEQEIRDAKLLSQKGNDLYYGRIMFPLVSTRHNYLNPAMEFGKATVENFYSRMLPSMMKGEKDNSFKHRYTNPSRPLYNFGEAKTKRFALMLEGCIDTISAQIFLDELIQMEKRGELENYLVKPSEIGVLGIYGTNGFSKESQLHVAESNFDKLFLAGDNDENFAGQTANIKLGESLQEMSKEAQVRIVTWTGNDVNELLQGGKENAIKFLQSIQDAVSVEEYKILVALDKAGDLTETRNQFDALLRIEELLSDLRLEEENNILNYAKTISVVSEKVGVSEEVILMHIMMVRYKNKLLMHKDNLKEAILTELMVAKLLKEE